MIEFTTMLNGVLQGIILQKIREGETYGYEITKYLTDLGLEDIAEGTVYTNLLRLEKKGFVNINKKKSDLGPTRKFYSLCAAGEEELMSFWERWSFIEEKMNEIKEKRHV